VAIRGFNLACDSGATPVSFALGRMGTRLLTATAFLLLVSSSARADGGGPLLLIINGMAFAFGFVAIVAVEWVLLVTWTSLPTRAAFIDSAFVNTVSTAIVGFGVPILVAVVSALVSMPFPDPVMSFALALGTWVFDNMKFPKVMYASLIFWWIVTFVLTVKLEAWLLERRWRKREFISPMPPGRVSLRINTVTYVGLFFVVGAYIAYENLFAAP